MDADAPVDARVHKRLGKLLRSFPQAPTAVIVFNSITEEHGTQLVVSVDTGSGFGAFKWPATYGVTSYSVTQRTREIGVRTALGAQVHQVWWLVMRRAVMHLAIGLPIGIAGALGVGRILQSVGFLRTEPDDVATLASIVVVLGAVALVASFWPARRAAHLNPVTALRYD